MSAREELHEPEPSTAAEPGVGPHPEDEPDRVFGVIYGAIAVGVLLAAEHAGHKQFAEVVGSIVIALILYWLAHSYALLTARRLHQGTELTAKRLGRAMVAELWIVVGAMEPLVVLVGFWLLGAKVGSAETAAIWAAALLVLGIEVVAGIRAHLTGHELLLQSLLGAGLGSLVIALSALLH